MEAKSFLSVEECRNVIDAIAEAENNCSGEIRVNIANNAGENVMESAVNVFYSLEMDKTQRKNGVFFFIASEDRRFAVIGDEGINNVVPENFWNDVCALMIEYFKKEEYGAGLVAGIKKCGEKLAEFFPPVDNDIDELPNEIAYEDAK